MLEQGKSVRKLRHEEEGAADTVCDELSTTPFLVPLAMLSQGAKANPEQS